MGKCTSYIRSFRHEDEKPLVDGKPPIVEETNGKNHPTMMRRIQLINNWQSYELETIIEKIMAMCEYEKKNHMNFTLFLQFFPALKPMSMKSQLKYFDLFDFTRSSYINIREIIFGISQIYFTPRSQYSEVLKEIYKRSKGEHLTHSEMKLFLHQNKSLLDPALHTDKNYEKNIKEKQPIQESNFDLMVAKYFDIQKYQRYFDFYDTQLEIQVLEDLRSKNDDLVSHNSHRSMRRQSKLDQKNENRRNEDKKVEIYEIRIRKNERVFLVDTSWFESWVKYMAIHGCYEISYEIQNNKQGGFERKNFSFDQVFMENAKLTRPPKIYNYDLLSEYETDLKPQLEIFKDFIPIPAKMWKKLLSIYKGGPQIERVYPHLFDTIIVNKVFLDSKCKFIEGKVVKCILQPHQILAELFKTESSKAGYIYFRRIPIQANFNKFNIEQIKGFSKWQQMGRNVVADRSLHQGFICFVSQYLKIPFETNYKSFGPVHGDVGLYELAQKQNEFSYGEILNFKTYAYHDPDSQAPRIEYKSNLAYINDMKKSQVKVHFVGTSDVCDDYYSIERLEEYEKLRTSTTDHKIVENRNIISALEGLQNCSCVNAVLQVMIATPFFSDYFLKQKHIRSLSSGTNLQSCLSTYFSKGIYDVKKHQKERVRLEDLYRKINSKVEEINFNQSTKQYAQKFVSKFLQTLSKQLGNPQKLFDKYPLVQTFEENKNEKSENNDKFKGSIIEAFFKLSESTKSICSTCKTESITTDYSYTLKVPLPEDEQVCFSVVYYPVKSEKFIKYAINIRKSQKFIKYVNKFADLIGIDHSRICFAQIRDNEFRKHYTEYDYESTLFNLDLNHTDTISAFELRNSIYNRQLQKDGKEKFHDKFLNLKKGDIVDFNMYTEWHVGRVAGFNKEKVLIENFEGQSEVEKKRIDQFKGKTEEKDWYQIDLLHRRINPQKEGRIEYFLMPSIISVAEWMNWKTVFEIVINHVKQYFDLYNREKRQDSKQVIKEDLANNLLAELCNFLLDFSQEQSEINPNNQSMIFSEKEQLNESNRKTVSTKSNPPSFKIKVSLKNSGEICAICSKKSIFQKQSNALDEKYCYGCKSSLNTNEPMAIKVNPAKISIVLDWIPQQIQPLLHNVVNKTFEHQTYSSVTTKIKNQINTIDDCFQLYIQTNKKVQIDCDKCGRNMGEQTRYLSECPNMLAIHLNRFKTYKNSEIKLDNKIEVKRQLTIEKIQMESKKEDIYELYAVICHREKKGIEKWYSCVLKNRNIWVKCEDTHVTLIDFNKINKQDIYMVFYRKKNIKCTILSMIF